MLVRRLRWLEKVFNCRQLTKCRFRGTPADLAGHAETALCLAASRVLPGAADGVQNKERGLTANRLMLKSPLGRLIAACRGTPAEPTQADIIATR